MSESILDKFKLDKDDKQIQEEFQEGFYGTGFPIIKIRQQYERDPNDPQKLLNAGWFYQKPPSRQNVSSGDEEGFGLDLIEDTEALDCIVLAAKNPRVHWPEKGNKSDPPDCTSNDGFFPDKENPYSTNCNTCQEPRKGTCKRSPSLLVLIPRKQEEEIIFKPYVVQFSRQGGKPTTMFVRDVLKKYIAGELGLNPRFFKTRIKTQLIEERGYKYYLPVYPGIEWYTKQYEMMKDGKHLKDAQIEQITEIAQENIDNFMKPPILNNIKMLESAQKLRQLPNNFDEIEEEEMDTSLGESIDAGDIFENE